MSELRQHYKAFLKPGRILLTGHSHQAWPDVARAGQQKYFDASAEFVDDKWGESVFQTIARVQRGILERLEFGADDLMAFGSSTHELLLRYLSSYTWDSSLRIVTSQSEFHSLYRQLHRLEEDGVQVCWVASEDRSELPGRLMAEIERIKPQLVAVSAVFFEDAALLPRLPELIAFASEQGCDVLIDAYHAFNVTRLNWGDRRDRLYVLGGGYKYAQFGEGLCFMRFPNESTHRPRITGWFSDFASLASARSGQRTQYGTGSSLFAGSTFDPSAFYRAEAVLDFFEQQGLSLDVLMKSAHEKTEFLRNAVETHPILKSRLSLASPRDAAGRGGFVAFRLKEAEALAQHLAKQSVWVDTRGEFLRLGPAPYTTESEMQTAVEAMASYFVT